MVVYKKEYMETCQMEDLAWKIATESFKNKVDKGSKPYLDHMKRIVFYMNENQETQDEELNCIAILHDLIEDCEEWKISNLIPLFTERIITAVDILTKKEKQSYNNYLELIASNRDAVCVKLNDLKDNMDITRLNEVTDKDTKRLDKYLQAHKYLTEVKNNK